MSALPPGSASDAYGWEVERAVDKRVIRSDYLAGDAAAALAVQQPRQEAAPPPPSVAVAMAPPALRFKVFLNGAQHGPYSTDELAMRIARGDIAPETKVWQMQWNPKLDKWKLAADVPELAGLFDSAIPDPDNDIPDPE